VPHTSLTLGWGQKNNLRAGAPFLQEQTEKVGVIQPGEEKAQRRPYYGLSVIKGSI